MTLHVSVPLSNEIYERAQKMAHQRDVAVEQLLAEHLEASLAESAVTLDENRIVEQEWLAYRTLHPTLRAQYLSEYVAIYQGQLVDHDPNQLALIKRLDQKYPDQFVFVRHITPDPLP